VRRIASLSRNATGEADLGSGDAVFIIEEGLVKLVCVEKSRDHSPSPQPDQIFQELFVSEERRAFNAVAGTDVLVAIIPRKSFEEILISFPTVARNFNRLLSRRLVKVEREFAGFGHTWSYQRLGIVLLQLAKDHGIQTAGGTKIPLRLTHEDLARIGIPGDRRHQVRVQAAGFAGHGSRRREHACIVSSSTRKSPSDRLGSPVDDDRFRAPRRDMNASRATPISAVVSRKARRPSVRVPARWTAASGSTASASS
jgi:CRP-like cAMP-binding protein